MMHPLRRLGRGILAGATLLLAVLAASPFVPARAQDSQPESAPQQPPPVIPEWEAVGLKDYGIAPEISLDLANGSGELKLSQLVLYGPVLVDFWATWCGPCRMAMPLYADLYEEYKDLGFSVLAVSEDSPQAIHKVNQFIEQLELPFPVVLDLEKEAGRAYYVRSLPTAYLIDRRGHVVSVEIGFAPGREKELAKKIEVLLKTDPSPYTKKG